MIKIIKGDLLMASETIIAHQVNTRGAMNGGLAQQIRSTYPKAFEEYNILVNRHRANKDQEDLRSTLLGKVQGVNLGGRYIANMFGQEFYGSDGKKYTDEAALYECLLKVRTIAEKSGNDVAMPYLIGCGLGGADWTDVESLILDAFNGYSVTLYKWEGKQ